MNARTVRLIRLVFWAAALFALVMALLPKPPHLPGDPSDKIQHVVAFAVLAGLAFAAFPKAPALKLLAGLSLFGALIEALQAIPPLHRDSSGLDWLADTIAAAIVLGIPKLTGIRRDRRV